MKSNLLQQLVPVESIVIDGKSARQRVTLSAFELSQIAISLCAFKDGREPNFTPAYELLEQASEFLEHPHRERLKTSITNNSVHRFQSFMQLNTESLEQLKIGSIDLKILLTPIGTDPQQKRKKPITRLGAITTMQGLKAAISRAFQANEADAILSGGKISIAQLKILESDVTHRYLRRGQNATRSRNEARA